MRSCFLLAALAAGMAASLAAAAVDGGDEERTTTDWQTTTTDGWETTTTAGWGTTTTVDPSVCPAGWVDSLEGCFLFHYTEADTWSSAQYECEKLGAFLAEPKSEDQMSLLVSLAVLEQAIVGVEAWWIGLTDQSHEGRWLWAHSVSDVSYTAWAPGSPATDVNSADCALMSADYGFSWQDTDCIDKRAAPICQKEMTTTTTTIPDTTTAMEESTTSYSPYHVELRGGYVGEDEAWGNVYAVNSQGFFGPVCDDGWGWLEAHVVCKQLGYQQGLWSCRSAYGPVDEDYSMDDVSCPSSTYSRLQDCDYRTNDNCGPNEAAGVHCYKDWYTTTAVPGEDCGSNSHTTTTTWSPEQQDEENVDW